MVHSFSYITDSKQPSAPLFFVEVTYLILFRSLAFRLVFFLYLFKAKEYPCPFQCHFLYFLLSSFSPCYPYFCRILFLLSLRTLSSSILQEMPPHSSTTSTAYKIIDRSDKHFSFRFMIHPDNGCAKSDRQHGEWPSGYGALCSDENSRTFLSNSLDLSFTRFIISNCSWQNIMFQ